jgi:hypothetical protein
MLVLQSQHTASSPSPSSLARRDHPPATFRPSVTGIARHRHAELIDGGRAAHVLQLDRGWPRRTPSAQRQSRRTDARSVCGRSFSAEGGLGTTGKVGDRREQCRRHWDVGGYTSGLLASAGCVCGSVEHYRLLSVSKSKRSPHLQVSMWLKQQQQLCLSAVCPALAACTHSMQQ